MSRTERAHRCLGHLLTIAALTGISSCSTSAIPPLDPDAAPGGASFSGMWDLYAKEEMPRYLGRLFCNGEGTPTQFQNNSRLADLLGPASDTSDDPTCTVPPPPFYPVPYCVRLDGQFHPLISGMNYRATTQSTHVGKNVDVVIQVEMYDSEGTQKATARLDFEATVSSINDLDEAEAVARTAEYFPGGLILDSAGGVLAESGNDGDQPFDEKLDVIAIRSLLF